MDRPPEHRARWPRGFRHNPLRFILAAATWRAMAWTFVLAVIALPLLIASIVLLPWLPLVARIADELGATGARWMGVPIRRRRAGRWFDWQKFVHLACQLVLSLLAFVIEAIGATAVVSLLVIPVISLFRSDLEFTLGWWTTSWFPGVLAAGWGFAIVFLFALAYLSWLIAGAAVYSTSATNAPTREDLLRLEESRAVLIDAFTGERSRIERELHDGVQQYLSALQLNIATAELKAADAPELAEPLEQAKLNARSALEALRQVIRGIYPQVLADRGLVEALGELLAHSGVDGELHTDIEPGSGTAISATPALLLYHCAAEGLTNAVRHGGAERVDIAVRFSRSTVGIRVDDDGAGLSEASLDANSGTGVAGLRERASALGGNAALEWSSRLGGARLRLELPASRELRGEAGTTYSGSGTAVDVHRLEEAE
ncbi:sensor histidine kinase [Dietzia timorensis]|nr:histidine kinase [Dietzia timorensis]